MSPRSRLAPRRRHLRLWFPEAGFVRPGGQQRGTRPCATRVAGRWWFCLGRKHDATSSTSSKRQADASPEERSRVRALEELLIAGTETPERLATIRARKGPRTSAAPPSDRPPSASSGAPQMPEEHPEGVRSATGYTDEQIRACIHRCNFRTRVGNIPTICRNLPDVFLGYKAVLSGQTQPGVF